MEPKPVSDLSSWFVGLLRLTLFPSPEEVIGPEDWWEKIVGESPESVANQPKLNILNISGPFMKGLLGLTIQSVRIDWNFLPKELSEPPAEIDDITLGKYPTVIESFTDLMDRWFSLDNIPSVVRLAFGALLLKPGESAAAVYRDLAQYMPCQFDLENARDFAYRINRKRFSTGRIPGLQLNRLASWSALGIEGQIAPIGTPRATKPVSTFFASRLELDINTDANFDGVIERNRIKELFFELVRLGEEIALEGDIP